MFKRILRAKTIRSVSRWGVWSLLIVLGLSMVLFFNPRFSGLGTAGPGPGGIAGILFGHKVPWDTFQEELVVVRRGFQQQLGGAIPEAFEPFLHQQVWDRLILKEAARRHIRISDEELALFIQRQPTFQQHGQFVPSLYTQYVRAIGSTERAFEERLRDDLRTQRFVESLNAQVTLTEEDVNTAYAKAYERMRAAFVVVEAAALEPTLTRSLTQTGLRAYYAAHQEAVRIPATRTLEYVGMSLEEAMALSLPIGDEEIHGYYEDHREEFTREDGMVPPLTELADTIRQQLREAHARKRVQNLALDLQDDVDAGLRVEEIAAARHLSVHTVGPLTASSPERPQGPSNSALRAAFEVPLGQMTQVFNDPRGVFLLKPLEEIPSRIPSFEEVRTQIEHLALSDLAREASQARARQLHDELAALRHSGRTFDEACATLRVKPQRPVPFTPRGVIEPWGEIPAVSAALFNLKPGELSEAIQTPQGFVMGLVEERLPFDAAQFAKDKEAFRKTLLESKQHEHLAATLDSLRTQARLKSFLEKTN